MTDPIREIHEITGQIIQKQQQLTEERSKLMNTQQSIEHIERELQALNKRLDAQLQPTTMPPPVQLPPTPAEAVTSFGEGMKTLGDMIKATIPGPMDELDKELAACRPGSPPPEDKPQLVKLDPKTKLHKVLQFIATHTGRYTRKQIQDGVYNADDSVQLQLELEHLSNDPSTTPNISILMFRDYIWQTATGHLVFKSWSGLSGRDAERQRELYHDDAHTCQLIRSYLIAHSMARLPAIAKATKRKPNRIHVCLSKMIASKLVVATRTRAKGNPLVYRLSMIEPPELSADPGADLV